MSVVACVIPCVVGENMCGCVRCCVIVGACVCGRVRDRVCAIGCGVVCEGV